MDAPQLTPRAGADLSPFGALRLPRIPWWVMGPIVLALLVPALNGLPAAVRAYRHEGVRGSFVATEHDCSRWSCTWYGRFRSDDLSVLLERARFEDGLDHEGQVVRALWEGEHGRAPSVYSAGTSSVFFKKLPFLGLATWWVVGLAVAAGRRWYRRARWSR